jgi:hypothetical protein
VPPPPRAFVDRPIARLLALCVALLCVAALAWLHRADLLPAAAAPEIADDPFSRCFAERSAQIDNMVAEGVVESEQANLFKSRAEAMCRAQHP